MHVCPAHDKAIYVKFSNPPKLSATVRSTGKFHAFSMIFYAPDALWHDMATMEAELFHLHTFAPIPSVAPWGRACQLPARASVTNLRKDFSMVPGQNGDSQGSEHLAQSPEKIRHFMVGEYPRLENVR